MSKRLFIWLFWPLVGAWAIWLLFATHAFAQALVAPQYVYTSADPVRPDALGIATPEGRFAVSKSDNCVDISPGMNVVLWQVEGFSGIGTLGTIDAQGAVRLLCNIRIEQLMDTTPCFTNADGVCDVRLEQQEN